MHCQWGRTSIARLFTTSMGSKFTPGLFYLSRAVTLSALVPRPTTMVAFRPTTHLHYSYCCRGGAFAKVRLASLADVRQNSVATIGSLRTTRPASRGIASKRPRATGSSQSPAEKPETTRARNPPTDPQRPPQQSQQEELQQQQQKRNYAATATSTTSPLLLGQEEGNDPVALATLRWVRSTVVGLNFCPWAGGALVGGRMRVIVHPNNNNNNNNSNNNDNNGNADIDCSRPEHSTSRDASSDDETACGAITSREDSRDDRRHNYGSDDGGDKRVAGDGGHGLLGGLVEVAAAQAVALGALTGAAAVNATTLVVARPPLVADFEEFLVTAEAVDDFIDTAGLRGIVQVATFHPQYRFEGAEEDDACNYTNRSPYPVLHLLLEGQVAAAVAQVGDPERVWRKNVETTRALGLDAMRRGVEACLVTPPNGGEHRRTKER